MRRLRPTKITEDTMEYIHSHPGRGFITRRHIREALRNRKEVRKNKKEGSADLIIIGKAHDGPKLAVYVTLLREGRYWSEVHNARPTS